MALTKSLQDFMDHMEERNFLYFSQNKNMHRGIYPQGEYIVVYVFTLSRKMNGLQYPLFVQEVYSKKAFTQFSYNDLNKRIAYLVRKISKAQLFTNLQVSNYKFLYIKKTHHNYTLQLKSRQSGAVVKKSILVPLSPIVLYHRIQELAEKGYYPIYDDSCFEIVQEEVSKCRAKYFKG